MDLFPHFPIVLFHFFTYHYHVDMFYYSSHYQLFYPVHYRSRHRLRENTEVVTSFGKISSLLNCSQDISIFKGNFLMHVYYPSDRKHH